MLPWVIFSSHTHWFAVWLSASIIVGLVTSFARPSSTNNWRIHTACLEALDIAMYSFAADADDEWSSLRALAITDPPTQMQQNP